MFATILLSLLGLLFTGLSVLVWRFKWLGLLAGYNSKKVTDPNALAVWCGKCLLVSGGMAFLMAGLNTIWHTERAGLVSVLIFAFLSQMCLVTLLVGVGKCTR
jgi:hypothetical protein